ncbi:MAG: YdcF family protein [Candidatus Acidiferrales bacterium]
MPDIAEIPKRNLWRRRVWTAAAILLVFTIAAVVLARGAGRWLFRPDPLSHADVIVVLSGGLPYRAEGAADVYQRGFAPLVWITRAEGPQEELAELGVQFVGEEEYNREAVVHRGVPENAVQILPEEIEDTEQEINVISQAMRRTGKHTVIIVTSPEHTRRVRALWNRLAGKDLTLIVRGADEDPIDLNHWWRNTRDTFSVVREYLGLINVWLGLPVRPHSHGE